MLSYVKVLLLVFEQSKLTWLNEAIPMSGHKIITMIQVDYLHHGYNYKMTSNDFKVQGYNYKNNFVALINYVRKLRMMSMWKV